MLSEKTIEMPALKDLIPRSKSNSRLEQLNIFFDAANEVLLVNWEGEICSEEIRKGYHLLIQQVKRFKPRKILLDFHKRLSIRRKDQRWVFGTAFPEMLRTIGDNVFVAIVLPVELYHGLVAELNGDELMHENNFLIIHHALYQEEALRWLNTMRMPATL